MATERLKRVFFNNVAIAALQGTGSYRPTGEVLTPLADSNGQKVGDTSEPQVGMMKMSIPTLKKEDEQLIRGFRDGEIIMEYVSGKTISGTFMSSSTNNDSSESDGFLEVEFSGNVRIV
jgi:hypothetical protein